MVDKPEKNGVFASRANGRAAQFVVNTPSQRNDLFARPEKKENTPYQLGGDGPLAGPTGANGGSPTSPKSRLPRPSPQKALQQTRYRPIPPLPMKEAFRIAREEEEVAVRGSPSPAPKTWRGRTEKGSESHRKTASQGSLGLGVQRRHQNNARGLNRDDTTSSLDSPSVRSQLSDISESDIGQKLRRFAEDHHAAGKGQDRGNGILSRARAGPKPVEAGKDLVRHTSNMSLDGDSPSRVWNGSTGLSRRTGTGPDGGYLSKRLTTRKSEPNNGLSPQASNERVAGTRFTPTPPRFGNSLAIARPSTVLPEYPSRSPDKSYAWQADEDFTAGDLQVSNSPPVKLGRTNTKLDAIRVREAETFAQFPAETTFRPRNTRLHELRAREIEADQNFQDESLESDAGPDELVTRATGYNEELRGHGRSRESPSFAEENRAREIATLTRRALATSRQDENHERRDELRPSSASLEITRKTPELLPDVDKDRIVVGKKTEATLAGPNGQVESCPGTPNTAFRSSADKESGLNGDSAGEAGGTHQNLEKDQNSKQKSVDSQDLLLRLARAASTSPPAGERSNQQYHNSALETKQKKTDKVKDFRRTVGFAGLRRDPSLDSLSSKRSANSRAESDPTDRIEQELSLFAPAGDQSERGSLRAPSPDSMDEELANETPRPIKPDPLMQPTPVVTGAYIDTPMTVKVEEKGFSPDPNPAAEHNVNGIEDHHEAAKHAGEAKDLTLKVPGLSRGRTSNLSPRKPKHTLSAKGDRDATRSLSAGAYRRSRSVPRTRSPLKNSSKPPTVKDDLREIHRLNHIEDSTLDDLAAELQSSQPSSSDSSPEKEVKMEKDTSGDLSSRKRELESLGHERRNWNSGLDRAFHGIRTARQGIERLENKISHADFQPKREGTPAVAIQNIECKSCADPTAVTVVTYVHLPIPRLYHRQPHFRFTLLGLLLFLFSLWYAAETSMCFLYCKPQYCYPGQPCDWSPDDPFWGYSIPVKLDQWTTGGQGRKIVAQLGPEIRDWVADVWESAVGIDITQIDTSSYDWHQMQRHRRRLLKKGLIEPFVARPEDREKFVSWSAARIARERVEAAREFGISLDDDESMTADEKVRKW